MELISALVAPGWSRKENRTAVVLLTNTRELCVHRPPDRHLDGRDQAAHTTNHIFVN